MEKSKNKVIIIVILSLFILVLLAFLNPQGDEFICVIKKNEEEPVIPAPEVMDDVPNNTEQMEQQEALFEVGPIDTPDGTATLMSDGVLFYYQMPFENVMGYKGYYNVTFVGNPSDEFVWHHKEYYVEGQETEEPIQIAESFGLEDSLDLVRDLDGDGTTELVCNCQTGGDGAKRVYIFQKKNEIIEVGSFNFDKLLPENAIVDHGTIVEYDPESGSVGIEYTIAEFYARRTEVFNDIWSAFTFEQYDPNSW